MLLNALSWEGNLREDFPILNALSWEGNLREDFPILNALSWEGNLREDCPILNALSWEGNLRDFPIHVQGKWRSTINRSFNQFDVRSLVSEALEVILVDSLSGTNSTLRCPVVITIIRGFGGSIGSFKGMMKGSCTHRSLIVTITFIHGVNGRTIGWCESRTSLKSSHPWMSVHVQWISHPSHLWIGMVLSVIVSIWGSSRRESIRYPWFQHHFRLLLVPWWIHIPGGSVPIHHVQILTIGSIIKGSTWATAKGSNGGMKAWTMVRRTNSSLLLLTGWNSRWNHGWNTTGNIRCFDWWMGCSPIGFKVLTQMFTGILQLILI